MHNTFDYLNPNENTYLHKLNKKDLFELLLTLNNYQITYQNKLNIDKDITFGIEIEFENVDYKIIQQKLDNLELKKLPWTKTKWETTDEITISHGGETKSPILKDDLETWKQLKQILEIINKNAIIINGSGAHIHVGKNILKDELQSWKNFLKIWSTYENIIYRFGYGEYLNARPTINRFAAPIAKEINKEINKSFKTYKTLAKKINEQCKNYAFNLDHLKFNCNYGSQPFDTIEFRNFNGTLNPIIWQNNINFIIKLLLYCSNNYFDNDIIDKRSKENKNKFIYPIYNYHQINIEQSIELADLIFDNNLDKINYLKQYFKNFQTKEEYILSKKLTK